MASEYSEARPTGSARVPPRKKPRLSDMAWWVFWAILMPEPILTDQKSLPRSKKCNPKNPAECCPERLAAVRSGEMRPDHYLAAWIFPNDPRRRVSIERRIKNEGEHDFDPYSWYVCPWCGMELPPTSMLPVPQIDGNND